MEVDIENDYEGIVVIKKSGKPFKNWLKEAKVLACVPHPITFKPAFIFSEFDGVVACHQCKLKDPAVV